MDKQRKHWIDIIQKTSVQYDKTILTLSAGAIALSLTLLNNLVLGEVISVKWAIMASWISFGCSLVFNLVSFLTSQKGYLINIEELDSGKKSKWAPVWTNATWILNILTLIAFIIGVIFLCWFSYNNLERGRDENMNKEKKESSISQPKTGRFSMPVVSNAPKTVRTDKISISKPDKIEKAMPVVSNPPKPQGTDTSKPEAPKPEAPKKK